ncbi:hypothetical protein FSP39_021857 [Pinctada imbricata]|uniref:Beta-1,4-galactosyltransferase n=1 Tax=Pinctada imbricata TaxID=66713 RepID=A0AA89C5Y4_PINIB|nr:hypothetical protein FSP39_021857 [Pinctada imbricata]
MKAVMRRFWDMLSDGRPRVIRRLIMSWIWTILFVTCVGVVLILMNNLSEKSKLTRDTDTVDTVTAVEADSRLCPLVPPNLKGRLKIEKAASTWRELETRYDNVKEGGVYSPNECQSRHKVAIIIPYRDREHHLRVFLNHYHPLLQRQQIQYAIYVIDLAPGSMFNRAMLLNIGFTEASRIDDYGCYIFHDVDFMAEDDRNIYTCSDTEPRHMGVSLDIHKYKLLYPQYFGGTSAMTKEQFMLVNGFSNKFFGWGGEDDDMYYRIKQNKMSISRIESSIARYTMLSHKPDMEMNKDRWSMVKEVKKRWRVDGLNSLQYKVLSINKYKLYTHIKVQINQKEIMKVSATCIAVHVILNTDSTTKYKPTSGPNGHILFT